MALKHWSGAHTKHRLLYHLVWLPKYRKRVLEGTVAVRLQHLLYEAAKVNRWWIEELKIMPDHVHMMLQIQPSIPLAKAVQFLKGGTSKILRQEFPELEEFLWGDSFWADGYFAETVGTADYATVKRYIKENTENISPKRR